MVARAALLAEGSLLFEARLSRVQVEARQWVVASFKTPPELWAAPDLTTIEADVRSAPVTICVGEDDTGSAAAHGLAVQLPGAGGLQAASLLPAGVRTLSVKSTLIAIFGPHVPATLKPEAVNQDDAAQRLCELFSMAPGSYREFRLGFSELYPSPELLVGLVWSNAYFVKAFRLKVMLSLAKTMQEYAPADGLTVSLPANKLWWVIMRPTSEESEYLVWAVEVSR